MPDDDNQTPFLRLYAEKSDSNQQNAKKLLELGANIKQMSRQGMFALKIALVRRQEKEIEYLVGKGADINQHDTKGRNLLHIAVNFSSSGSDATFEIE